MLKKREGKFFAKRRGTGLTAVALCLCLITSVLAVTSMRLVAGMFGSSNANRINAQAYEYAKTKEEKILAKHSNVSNSTRENISGTDYADKVTIVKGAEGGSSSIKIEVFYKNEDIPRAALKVSKTNQNSQGCPIGTIIAWPSHDLPTDGGEWLLCDGETIPSDYTTLISLLGKDKTPALCGHGTGGYFLRGWGSGRTLLDEQRDAVVPVSGSFFVYVFQNHAHYGSTSSSTWKSGYWTLSNAGRDQPQGVFSSSGYASYRTEIDHRDGKDSYDNFFWKFKHTFSNKNVPNIRTAKESRPCNVAVNYLIKAL